MGKIWRSRSREPWQPCSIRLLDYRHVMCACGWSHGLAENEWGIKAAKDRLLDLWLAHEKRRKEFHEED